MRAGHSAEPKKAFYEKAVDNLSSNPGIDPANVMISLLKIAISTGRSARVSRNSFLSFLPPISYERGNIWRR